eukprot:GHVR01081214.1.p1 GENE.GHVR01081214.1~~GHVR01081214.1.p1  ORF type:complete len:119 (-),score=17.53 GHVR01081214.1:648-1004(-)
MGGYRRSTRSKKMTKNPDKSIDLMRLDTNEGSAIATDIKFGIGEEYDEQLGLTGRNIHQILCRLGAALQYRDEDIKQLVEYVKDSRDSYDCDEDAHTHNLSCRACEAEKLLKEINHET